MTEQGARTACPRAAGIGVVWVVRLLAGICIAAGLYVGYVALDHLLHGQAAGPWLLPEAVGGLTMFLGICVACEAALGAIIWREFGRRMLVMVLLAGYVFAALPVLGFLAASMLLAVAVATFYPPHRLLVGAGGVIIAVGLWALFSYALNEPLPGGLWWQ